MTARPADLRGSVGTLGYYRARHADFVRRHPDLPPPDYYLGYGDRYMRRFFSETRPHLSEAGQRWLTDTRHALQEALENERARDADAFDRMECTPGALRRFCYGTHPSAYIEAGLANLDPLDWSTIVLTPDASAILTPDGLGQIVDTAGRLVVARAQALLADLEAGERRRPRPGGHDDLPLFAAAPPPPAAPKADALREALDRINPDDLSPRAALEALYDLKRRAGSR